MAFPCKTVIWMITYNEVDSTLSKTKNFEELDLAITGKKIQAYRNFYTHSHLDSFWKQFFTPIEKINQDTPVLLGCGWYDPFLTEGHEPNPSLKSHSNAKIDIHTGLGNPSHLEILTHQESL